MLKHFLPKLGLIFLFSFNQSLAQSWDTLNSDLVGGVFVLASDTNNHILYAGGTLGLISNGSVEDLAQWNGTNWSAVGMGNDLGSSSIFALMVYNNELYVGGDFYSFFNASCIAKWNGSNWNALDIGFFNNTSPGYTTPYQFAVYNNEIYAAGSFRYIMPILNYDTTNAISRWDGTHWNKLGTSPYIGVHSSNPSGFDIQDMIVFNNELYVCGLFDSAGNVPTYFYNVAKWNGSNWLSAGVNSLVGPYCFAIYNNELFMGGNGFSLLKLNGSAWSPFASIGSSNPNVLAMTVYKNSLIIAGIFDSIDGVPAKNIARWNGTTWSAMGTNLSNPPNTALVYSLTTLDNCLYAGGVGFKLYSGTTEYGIARWCEPTSIEENNLISSQIKIFPNPFNTITIFEINQPEKLIDAEIKIYNTIGNLQKTISIKEKRTAINKEKFSSGIYIYKFFNNQKLIATGKLVVL